MGNKIKVLIGEKNDVELDREEHILIADEIPFDNTNNSFDSEDVQGAIEEVGAGASPGFSFSRTSNVSSKAWLNRAGGVASNRAGIAIFIDDPVITKIACTCENQNTYDVTVYEHEGDEVNLVELITVSVINSRTEIFDVNVSATKGKQLAVRVTNGSARNPGVDLQLKGNN